MSSRMAGDRARRVACGLAPRTFAATAQKDLGDIQALTARLFPRPGRSRLLQRRTQRNLQIGLQKNPYTGRRSGPRRLQSAPRFSAPMKKCTGAIGICAAASSLCGNPRFASGDFLRWAGTVNAHAMQYAPEDTRGDRKFPKAPAMRCGTQGKKRRRQSVREAQDGFAQ